MAWETTWKPFDVEKMIREMNLLWDSFFPRELRYIRKSIDIVETKEIVVKRVGISRVIKGR